VSGEPSVLRDLVIALCAAVVVLLPSRRLKIPPAVGFLITGPRVLPGQAAGDRQGVPPRRFGTIAIVAGLLLVLPVAATPKTAVFAGMLAALSSTAMASWISAAGPGRW